MNLEELQNTISKLNNEDKTYAILVKSNIYAMLQTTRDLSLEVGKTPIKNPIASYYGIIVEIDNNIDKDFKPLTKKEYDEWRNKNEK